MGPGHLAIGLAAKPVAPKAPLWVLLVATEVLDLLCFAFVAAGIETTGISQTDINQGVTILSPASLPWSHGLFMAVVWSVVVGLIAFRVFRDRRTGVIIGMVVFSHWILDFIVHIGDLPLLFDTQTTVGLGLWGSGPGLVISGLLEVGLLAGGLAIYLIHRKRSVASAKPS